MIKTSELIEALVADAQPVGRLRPPAHRAALWLCLAALIFCMLTLVCGLRPDLSQRVEQPEFVVCLAAMLLTGALAAGAAFTLNVPGRSGYWAFLPLPALGVWVATIGQGGLTHLGAGGHEGWLAEEMARIIETMLTIVLPLSVSMIGMLRQGTALRPLSLTQSGSLAVAAISAAGMTLFVRLDATAMVLMWNLGLASLVVALGSLFGRRLIAVKQRSLQDLMNRPSRRQL